MKLRKAMNLTRVMTRKHIYPVKHRVLNSILRVESATEKSILTLTLV
jgi:hypothetical protein